MIYLHSLPDSSLIEKDPTSNVQEQVHVEKYCLDENIIPCNIETWSDHQTKESLDDILKYASCCKGSTYHNDQ